MKLTPLFDRIIVKRDEAETKTPGGIVLPDQSKEKPQKGKVIAVGEGKMNNDGKRIKMSVEVGDRVVFSSYAGNEVELDGEEFLIMNQDNVLATIE